MFDPTTGSLIWQVDSKGYEIDPDAQAPSTEDDSLGARFYRPNATDEYYARRGVIRRLGGELREYCPLEDTPGLARRLAGLHPFDTKTVVPSDEDILSFTDTYGLLLRGDEMSVRTLIYTAKYLSVFASAVDGERKQQAREVFNERVLPNMTVKLVGSATGRPTANWSLEVEPVDLISTAWLQMAAELTQGQKLKKCVAPDCLEWFSDRPNKKFCNNRCKMAFHKDKRLAES